jgi:glycosyltransferase involved in cell wall biosynthesis
LSTVHTRTINAGVLNLFYEEPEPDRWLWFDRYPRRVIRRLIRGKRRPGGQQRVFLNLCAGLDRIGARYRVNDYRYIQRQPEEIACIIGQPHVLDKLGWKNPIVLGPAVFSHPTERPNLLSEFPAIKRILVPGEWMRQMCEPFWGDKVVTWPVGIDTEKWIPAPHSEKDIDVVIYDKILWQRETRVPQLLEPIRRALLERHLRTAELRYGHYREEDFHNLLRRTGAMIFLCEHETQGIAYQQALSCGVPLLAWDRAGFWEDPSFFPEKVRFGPVTSVPYWDERCGLKFESINDFEDTLNRFLVELDQRKFTPREFILGNLTLEKCAERYVSIVDGVQHEPRESWN